MYISSAISVHYSIHPCPPHGVRKGSEHATGPLSYRGMPPTNFKTRGAVCLGQLGATPTRLQPTLHRRLRRQTPVHRVHTIRGRCLNMGDSLPMLPAPPTKTMAEEHWPRAAGSARGETDIPNGMSVVLSAWAHAHTIATLISRGQPFNGPTGATCSMSYTRQSPGPSCGLQHRHTL